MEKNNLSSMRTDKEEDSNKEVGKNRWILRLQRYGDIVNFQQHKALGIFLLISILVFFYFFYLVMSTRISKETVGYEQLRALTEVINKVAVATRDAESTSRGIIAEKKEKLSNVATISFHYSNKEQIKSFYNDYFKEPTIESIVSETARELSGDVKGSLPATLEVAAGGKDLKKWISTIKLPDISVNGMFKRYQRQTIINNQVTIGLEVLDVDLTNLESFNKTIEELKKDFDFEIDKSKIEQKKVSLRGKAAEKTLSRLEEITGWVLIDGKFKIEDFPDGYYRLVYSHPVNKYLPISNQPILITCTVKKNAINEHFAGNYAQSIDQIIPLKIYGQIWQPLNRNTGNMEVQITPLAIY